LKEFTGQGIGTRLFEEMQKWAVMQKIHRIDLTVMKHNERAIALYKKMVFEIEGTKEQGAFTSCEWGIR
jgi:ribosomal protein S18 acetylase RimI-like enzyme